MDSIQTHSACVILLIALNGIVMLSADLLEERKDPEAAVPRRPEAIHLYGVDVLSTAECLAYFGDYGPTHVEWIDDSSCNVVFADKHSAKRAMVAMGNPLPPGDAPHQQGGGMGSYLLVTSALHIWCFLLLRQRIPRNLPSMAMDIIWSQGFEATMTLCASKLSAATILRTCRQGYVETSSCIMSI